MIIQLIIGAAAAAVLLILVSYARQSGLALTWWKWALTVLGVVYAVFVIEVIVGFLGEDAAQAAAVLGLITAIPAVIWGVLLARFVFRTGRSGDVASQRTTAE